MSPYNTNTSEWHVNSILHKYFYHYLDASLLSCLASCICSHLCLKPCAMFKFECISSLEREANFSCPWQWLTILIIIIKKENNSSKRNSLHRSTTVILFGGITFGIKKKSKVVIMKEQHPCTGKILIRVIMSCSLQT